MSIICIQSVHAFSINFGELLAIAGNTTFDLKGNKGDQMTLSQSTERTATLIVIRSLA